jgi:hypothetical protein
MMKNLHPGRPHRAGPTHESRLILGLLFLAILSAQTLIAGPREPVALIYQVSGEALRKLPGHSSEPLRLLDRLPAGVTLELKPGSRVSLAFATGKRYEISGSARATLGKGDLAARSSGVRALAPFPPFRLVPIAESERPGPAAGAIFIRGDEIEGLYPRRGTAALAGETVLLFKPVPGATEYRIEVQDGQGRTVFQTNAESSPVQVPAGILHSGRRYWWTVRTLNRPGPVAQGEAEIVTLSASAAQAREGARRALAAEGDGSLPLMAEIDRGWGLLLEARRELRQAASRDGDPRLQEALTEIEARLEDCNDLE